MKEKITNFRQHFKLIGMIILFFSGITTDLMAVGEQQLKIGKAKTELKYVMVSQGYEFGSSEVTRSRIKKEGQWITEEISSTRIGFEDKGQPYDMKAHASAWLKNEDLIMQRAEYNENGVPAVVKLDLEGDVMSIRARSGKGTSGGWEEYPRRQYDYTTGNIPLNLLKPGKSFSARKLLDLTDLTISVVKLRLTGQEKMRVQGHRFSCQIIDYRYKNSRGKMWIAQDALGYFIVKDKSTGKFGPIMLKLDRYSIRKK